MKGSLRRRHRCRRLLPQHLIWILDKYSTEDSSSPSSSSEKLHLLLEHPLLLDSVCQSQPTHQTFDTPKKKD